VVAGVLALAGVVGGAVVAGTATYVAANTQYSHQRQAASDRLVRDAYVSFLNETDSAANASAGHVGEANVRRAELLVEIISTTKLAVAAGNLVKLAESKGSSLDKNSPYNKARASFVKRVRELVRGELGIGGD
jgi:hypothetical protein